MTSDTFSKRWSQSTKGIAMFEATMFTRFGQLLVKYSQVKDKKSSSRGPERITQQN